MVALLDPLSFVDSQLSGQAGMMGGQTFSSNLDKLLPAWGLKFTDQIVGDPAFATQVQAEGGPKSDPTVLSITADGMNRKDPLGAVSNDLLLPFAGAFTGTPAAGLKEVTLVSTSKQAGLVDVMTAQMGSDAVRKQLKSHPGQFSLAVRLTGRFKTAFPDGRPAPSEKEQPKPDPSPDPAASPSPSPSGGPARKEGNADAVVVLVGDSDFVYDEIAGRAEQALNQTIFVPSNGNLNFIESCIEELAGDSNLIGIRSRASGNRPFIVVKRMEARAQEKYQNKIDELETSLADTRQKLSDLQGGKQTDEQTVLSPEQQAEIKKFHASEAKINQELKQVRKNLRQEIDSLQNKLKWLNLLGMPVLVTIVGLTLAGIKRRKRAAR